MMSRRFQMSSPVTVFAIAVVALCAAQMAACGSSSHVNGEDGGAGAGGAADGSAGASGGGGTTDAGGGGAGTAGTGGRDGGADASDAGIACGDLQCGANQVCVRQSCGGGAVAVCAPPQDGGMCPAGWSSVATCPGSGRPGCVPPPCSPPPPKCVMIPAACNGTPTCGCLPFDICTSGTCLSGLSGQVSCASE